MVEASPLRVERLVNMELTHKIQIYPSAEAQEKLWRVSRLCCQFWNAMIEQRQDRKTWGIVNKYTQKKELPQIKKELPEFKEPSSQVLQEVSLAVDRSYKSFFKKRKNGDYDANPPKFRSSKQFFTQTFPQPKSSFTMAENRLRLAFGKGPEDWITIKIPELKISAVSIVKIKKDQVSGKWFALLSYKVAAPKIQETGEAIYFDPGCKTSLTGIKTNGEFIEYDFNPLRQLNLSAYKYIDKLKSQKDRIKNRNSKSWRRLHKRIQKIYSKINTRTKTNLHTLANIIIRDHPDVKSFKIGNWEKRKTLADTTSKIVNKAINRAVQNNNPIGKLFEILSYKTHLKGREAKKFEERGATRTCSHCLHRHKQGIPPNIRIFKCKKCCFQYSRDHQSCLNFIRIYEPALWLRLPEILTGRSMKTVLAPFSYKPQISVNDVGTLLAS